MARTYRKTRYNDRSRNAENAWDCLCPTCESFLDRRRPYTGKVMDGRNDISKNTAAGDESSPKGTPFGKLEWDSAYRANGHIRSHIHALADLRHALADL
tara:strand:- start:1596 stop:1892 length:297 start_codon:yes stop_codon:yes gene_type:complete